ncbi:MAG: MFS transporter, partial [Janthinobacterium lividum]
QHLGMTGTSTGVLLSAFFWGYVITQIPGGWVSNRFGAKRVIITCLLGVCATGLLTGIVENYRLLLAVRFLMGLFEGVIWPSFAVVIMRWFPASERSRAVNLAQYVLPLSSALMAPIAGWMIYDFGWKAMFLLQAAPVFLLALAWLILGSSTPEQDRRLGDEERQLILSTRERETALPSSLGEVFRMPVLWGLCLAYFLWMTGFYGFGLWLPTLIRQLSAEGVGSVALLTALPFAFAVVGLYVNATWADKAHHSRAWHFIIPLTIGGLAMLAQNALHPTLFVSMVLLVVTGVSLISGIGVWWAWALGMVPRNQVGPSAGMINFLGNFGGIVGPIVVGMAAGAGGSMSGSFHVVGYALLGSALVNLLVWLSSRTSQPSVTVAAAH